MGNKWAAVLGFRLQIEGARPENFKLTGNLQDTGRPNGSDTGVLAISVSTPYLLEDLLAHHNLQNVWPNRPGGDHSKPPEVQRGDSTTVTVAGGMSGFPPGPSLNLGISAGKTRTWSETHQVICTRFKNVSPRVMFEMDFSSLPGQKSVPDALSFAVLITFPARPVAFGLELQISRGDASDR